MWYDAWIYLLMATPLFSQNPVSHPVNPAKHPAKQTQINQLNFFPSLPLLFPDASPSEDRYLEVPFGSRNLRDRKRNKSDFPALSTKTPTLLLYPRLFRHMPELLTGLLPALAETDCVTVILADKKECPASYHLVVPVSEKAVHRLWASADLILLPPNTADALVESCFRYGLIPIVPEELNLVMDYDPTLEKGNAFTYKTDTVWQIYAALIRALETHKLSFDWQRIQKNGMDM